MTDEERANRNPAPEIERTTTDAIEAMPRVLASALRRYRVYVLQSARHLVTMNYAGTAVALDQAQGMFGIAHVFFGPRVDVEVALRDRGDGTLTDAEGNVIIVREYTGPDA